MTVVDVAVVVEVRAGSYHDSVTLMQVTRAVAAVPGVLAAQVAMGTDLNLDLLAGMGFPPPPGAGPNDLVVAVRARDEEALAAGRQAVEEALTARPGARGAGGPGVGGSGGAPEVRPRTTGAAVRASGATLALISVPGEHAFVEAMDALAAGADVMVFSDNVPLAQEVRLKQEAARRGRLVMGPDCGTAVIGGVGLGFANVVVPGPVGIVAASGTGAQQLLCLLDAAGIGVRHCLGVGGRDLSAAVGGASTRQALALLDADPTVELIVVVSKPPAEQVERELRAFAAGLATPVRFALLGAGRPDLTEAARAVAEALGRDRPEPRSWPAALTGPATGPAGDPAGDPAGVRYTRLRGGFAGGTLCDEAMVLASAVLGPVPSNIPLDGAPRLAADLRTLAAEPTAEPTAESGTEPATEPAHAMIDFGDDALTRGRPHPMIDGSLRADWLVRQGEAATATDGVVVLLDVVLGHGAHPDPAAELAPAIARAQVAAAAAGGALAVVVSLCGTEGDPQGLDRQATALQRAGAQVHLSNADAARAALALLADALEEIA